MAGRFAGAPQGYLDFDQRQADKRREAINAQHLQAIMGQMLWKQQVERRQNQQREQAMEDAGGALGPMFKGMPSPPGAQLGGPPGGGMQLPMPPGMANGPQPPAPGQPSVPSSSSNGGIPTPPGGGPVPVNNAPPWNPQGAGPGQMRIPPAIQQARDRDAGEIQRRELQPGGGGMIPTQPMLERYRGLPTPPEGAGSPGEPPGTPGEIPSPPNVSRETSPSTPNQAPKDEPLTPTLASAVQALTAQGLTGARLMRALEQIAPRLDAMAQQQIRALNVQLSAERARIAAGESARRTRQGDARIDQADDRLDEAAATRRQRQPLVDARVDSLNNAGTSGLTPEAIDLKARQLLDDPSKALVNIGRGVQGAKNIELITNRAAEMAAADGSGRGLGLRSADFRANSNSLNRLTSSYDAVTAFEQTAVRNGHVLIDLANKVDTTGIPAIERWIRAGRKAVAGDPDVSAFQAQMQVYRTEAARILTNPNLTGQLTDSARKEVEHFLSGSDSAEQINRVVNLLENDFKNRKITLEQQMDAIRDRMSRGVGAGAPPAAPGAPRPGGGSAAPSVPTATNAAGEKLEYRDGQWQPAQTLPRPLPASR